jgi:hypothetical protein
MEAVLSSKMLVNFYQIIWRYTPEDSIHYRRRCENLKSNKGTAVL